MKMVKIVVTGTTSKKLKKLLQEACIFYMHQLGFRKRKRLLEIFIQIGHYGDHYGLCEFNYDFQWPEFLIHLDRDKGKEEMVKTLAHEMVHAKQFLRRELKEVRHQMHWLGVPSENEEWEDEAYLMEEQLYNEYINART